MHMLVSSMSDSFSRNHMQLWPAVMGAVEWNKKAELMIEQALRHVKSNLMLLARWTKSDRAQIVLMVTMQDYCFINQNFLKIYNRFCLLFYKGTRFTQLTFC